jgi:5-methylcytosine-specific restriction protein A
MTDNELATARREAVAALARLRVAGKSATGQDLIDHLVFQKALLRQVRHDALRVIARLESEGEFAQRGVRAGPAVADLLGCRRGRGYRLARLAGQVFPTTLAGAPVEPVLAATATALAAFEIDQAHAEVIDQVLAGAAARRLTPGVWADAEAQCADWARLYSPDELRGLAQRLVEGLDQDGAEADHALDAQVNELHLCGARDGIGGRLRGRFDSVTYDALTQVIKGLIKPETDEGKSLAQRQADALGEMCEHLLDEGQLPECADEKPHLSVTVAHDTLTKQLHGACLTATGLPIGPRELRRLACDSTVIPLVMGGVNEPLDVGRERRTATKYQRRALAARDGGCAHPGCTRPANWCSAHHIVHWADGGRTSIDNLVLLCVVHHRMIHSSGWTVRIRNHMPEFIPPAWLDVNRTPRRKPSPP